MGGMPLLLLPLLLALYPAPAGPAIVDVQLQELKLGQRNVCPHEELEVVTVSEPCVQAVTRYVRARKADCHGPRKSCSIREPKTVYYRTYKTVNRTRRHVEPRCCFGWQHFKGEDGCLRGTPPTPTYRHF